MPWDPNQNKRQLSQQFYQITHVENVTFFLRSSFLKISDYFFASLMLFLMNDDLSRERAYDNNIRKVLKYFQKQRVWWEHRNILEKLEISEFFLASKDALLDKNFVSRWLRLVGFSYSLRISFFLSLQGSAGLPRRSPRPPALVREGFSSEEHIEPGLGSTRCTSSPPPSRSHACPPPTCWAEGSR